ncbi:MAG: S41 family peptidase [Bacteroidota bacterium]|nr:S41 family peptidase [Bacteroidota bacterium]
MNIKSIAFFTVLSLLFVKPNFVQAQDPGSKMNPKEIKLLVDSLSKALNRLYVFPEKATLMINAVNKQYKSGAYNKISNRFELSMQIHKDLQQAHKDGHLSIMYEPEFAKDIETPRTDSMLKEGYNWMLKRAREDNFAFKKTEILQGNIGYVRWDGFMEFVDESKATLNSAFQFVSNCKAVIIDMRYNGGGSPEMVLQTQNYFFNEKASMNHIIGRSLDTAKRYTDPSKTDFKLNMPVYILTSHGTFSGAEDFTYGLKYTKRAIVVGDTTGGGAHPTGSFSIGQGFVVNIPTHRSSNEVTKTDWEGTGVWPDIAVPSEQALTKAHVLILTQLIAKTSDEREKYLLQWNMNTLENKILLSEQLKKETIKIAKEGLAKYCGDYIPANSGAPLLPMSIILKGDYICRHLNNGSEDIRIVPVSATKFIYDDETGRAITFTLDKDGVATDLILSRPDGVYTLNKKK